MFGWIKLLQKKFSNLNPMVQIAIAIVMVLVFGYLIKLLVYSNFTGQYLENFGTPKKLIYFHMNGCGYCKKFTPEWEKFVQGYNGDLTLQKLERKEAGDALLEKHKIQGFPTILLVDENGEGKQYDGERTKSGLESFVSNH